VSGTIRLLPSWVRALPLLLVALAAIAASPAAAQEEAPAGRIAGTLVSGTAGAELGEVTVRLVILEDSDVVGDEQASVQDGRFEFTVPAIAHRTYVVAARYQDVPYIAPPVELSPEEPEATVELMLYQTTNEAPDVRILETIVTVVALDRARGELLLLREDLVSIGGDRVFVGGESGVTLQIPAPNDTIEASGGELEDGALKTTMPLYPGDRNTVVSQYVVGYELEGDEYRLRVTAPVPTGRMELRVPEGYVQRLEPLEEALRAQDYTPPEAEGVVMKTVVLEALVEPGRGMLVDLVGLAPVGIANPLTEQPGAGLAAGLALGLISGVAAVRLRRKDESG